MGDAAGLVEPITGEGVAFAMQSSHLAATAIIEVVQQGSKTDAYCLYKRKHKEIAHILDYAQLLRYLIFPEFSNKLFMKVLPKTSMLTHKHMDLMADELEYKAYVKYLSSRVVKGLVKKVPLVGRDF